MEKVYIHIGLPKTGTTYLQKYVFPRIKNIDYISPANTSMPNYILAVDVKNRPVLISDEYLSTNYFMDAKGNNICASRYKIADRLKTLFPTANIIIVVRDKDEWIKSFYVQYIKSVYRPDISFTEFKKQLEKNGTLDFEDYISYLKNKFDRVLVLYYEDLKNNPHEFVKKICDFMGVEMPELGKIKRTNIRLNSRQIRFISWIKKRKIKLKYKKYIVDIFLFITGGKR